MKHLKNLKTGRILYLGPETTLHVPKAKSTLWDSPFKARKLKTMYSMVLVLIKEKKNCLIYYK